MDELGEIFKKLDKNNDGHLSYEEITVGIQEHEDELSASFGLSIDFKELFEAID